MKLLLMSDTHGSLEESKQVMNAYPNMDYYIHLGDVGFPLQELNHFLFVKGNHDQEVGLVKERCLTIDQRCILCMHGDLYDEETVQEVLALHSIDSENIMDICMNTLYKKLAQHTLAKGCDTLFFGHTHHQVDVEVEGVRIINPGSLWFGTPHSGYAVVEIMGKTITCEFHDSKGMEIQED